MLCRVTVLCKTQTFQGTLRKNKKGRNPDGQKCVVACTHTRCVIVLVECCELDLFSLLLFSTTVSELVRDLVNVLGPESVHFVVVHV